MKRGEKAANPHGSDCAGHSPVIGQRGRFAAPADGGASSASKEKIEKNAIFSCASSLEDATKSSKSRDLGMLLEDLYTGRRAVE
jgi:hypothetical protein